MKKLRYIHHCIFFFIVTLLVSVHFSRDILKKDNPSVKYEILSLKSVVHNGDEYSNKSIAEPEKNPHLNVKTPPPYPHLKKHMSTHYILAQSNEDFVSKSISQMLIPYGESDGGGSCSDDFGNSLVKRWRATKEKYCNETATTSPASSIDCFLIHQTGHAGYGDNLCLLQNVVMRMDVFANTSLTLKAVKNYVDNKHAPWHQPYIKYPKGFLKGNCEISPKHWNANNFPGRNMTQEIGHNLFVHK